MSASVVPVIYDRQTKRVLRWYVLDSDEQLDDPAFKPANLSEGIVRVPLSTYRAFGMTAVGHPALLDLQDYVSANT